MIISDYLLCYAYARLRVPIPLFQTRHGNRPGSKLAKHDRFQDHRFRRLHFLLNLSPVPELQTRPRHKGRFVRKHVCETTSQTQTSHVSYCTVHTQSSGPTYLFPQRDRKAYDCGDFRGIVRSRIVDSSAGPGLISLQVPNRKRGQISARSQTNETAS
jgi:hypothetical protein